MNRVRILVDDCRKALAELPDNSVDVVVTSPPYYRLREYGPKGNDWELGWEPHPHDFVRRLTAVFSFSTRRGSCQSTRTRSAPWASRTRLERSPQ